MSKISPAADVCARYLERFALPSWQCRELLDQTNTEGKNSRAAMAKLHALLADLDGRAHAVDANNPAHASVVQRLQMAYGGDVPVVEDLQHRERLVTVPPISRTSMMPQPWPRYALWRLFRRAKAQTVRYRGQLVTRKENEEDVRPDAVPARGRWHRSGTVRRVLLLGLALAQTYVATHFMTLVLPYHGTQPLEIAILVLFAILFGWISAGFWTAVAGFALLALGGERYSISRTLSPEAARAPIAEDARTAVVMPIANEHVPRVFAGLRATYESVAKTGQLERFDFFVLSDSSDPNIRIAEINAWLDLCRAVGGFGRVFYRLRQHRIKRKSGNIADFCRRWGSGYRYMIVLDADSVMSGECLTTLVRLSEANPSAGIIQTAPRATGRDTLHARVQQFATRVYGPLFTAGLHFWQLGESHYWGHNAIIRLAPFIRHCALARLPGRGALSGEILSHDSVEAALMSRAGWAVWIAYDLEGSYEEMPPNLVDELKRDRRWCQGNLMNFRLFLMKGLHPAHRAVFMTGVMTYLSAPLWFLFLILSTGLLAVHTLTEPKYFIHPYQLFPVWPEWRPEWAVGLFTATATLLFLPKILSVVLVWLRGPQRFGGGVRLALSMLGEFMLSALLAPIRMLFHTEFVVTALANWSVQWKPPPRADAETTWSEAFRRHRWHTLLGIIWAAGVYWLNPSFLWWLAPVVGALMLSVPLSVYSSRVSIGRRLRKKGFFLIPEESRPPPEIRATRKFLKRALASPDFVDAVTDPVANALSCAAGVAHMKLPAHVIDDRLRLVGDALTGGPDALTRIQKATLLSDPIALSRLHFEAWTSSEAHSAWARSSVGSAHDVGPIIPLPARSGAQPRTIAPTPVH